MVRETSVIKLSAIMRGLDTIYPDLKSWNYKGLYRREREDFYDDADKKKWLGARAHEIEKTTQAIISFIEMGFDEKSNMEDGYLKKLIKYYLVLMDAKKYNLNYGLAADEIFETT